MIGWAATLINGAFGVGLAGFMLTFLYKRHAVDWEPLAKAYGRPWREPALKKRFANLVLYSEGRPARSYKGLVALGLHADGVALRHNRFLAPFHPAIFVPYGDIRGWDQGWYLDAKSTELTFSKAPASRLIMPRKQVEWMLQLDPGAARISQDRPPHGTRPWATFVLALVMGAMGLILIVALAVKGLTAMG